jgi:hypothetical protein
MLKTQQQTIRAALAAAGYTSTQHVVFAVRREKWRGK